MAHKSQQPATVADLIAALQKRNPKALVLWGAPGACVAVSVNAAVRPVMVSQLNDCHYSTTGPESERTVDAVLIDVLEDVVIATPAPGGSRRR